MNSLDFVVFVVMVLSILLAVLRGFTREVLTVVAWIGAIFAVLYGLPIMRPFFRGLFDSATTADIAAGAVLGISTLIILSLISNQLGKAIKKSGLGAVDRSLGAFFGAARGAILLCLLYILLQYLVQPNMPEWLADAKSQPLLEKGSEALKRMAPPEFAGMTLSKPDATTDEAPEAKDLPDGKEPVEKDIEPKAGYHDHERNDLDRLIENTEHSATPDKSEPKK